MFQEQSNVRIEQLNDENTSLRNRLRDVAHSPLSDNEKQQLLLESHRHSSAPASIATNVSVSKNLIYTECFLNLMLQVIPICKVLKIKFCFSCSY